MRRHILCHAKTATAQSESITVFTAELHTDSTGVMTLDSKVAILVFK